MSDPTSNGASHTVAAEMTSEAFDDVYDLGDPDNDTETASTEKPAPVPVKKNTTLDKVIAIKKKAAELTAKYPNVITHATNLAEAAVEYYYKKTPWALIKGGLSLAGELAGDHLANINAFCDAHDGWRYLASNSKQNIGFLFRDVISTYPMETIRFRDHTTAECYKLPMATVVFYKLSNQWYLYFNTNQVSNDDITTFLVNEKFKTLNSKFLFIASAEEYGTLTITPTMPNTQKSKKATELANLITSFVDAGLSRSIFLYGAPGVGKTTAAHTILKDLDYRTIVFSASNKLVSFDLIRDLISLLKIDAVIIDDFDQFSETNKSLDMLEYFNRNLKVLIGIANSLKNFHPAILRPGRFDEVIRIDALDKACIDEALGSKLSKAYYERVKHFPIAYVNELKKKSAFLSAKQTDEYIGVLDTRVNRALTRANLDEDINSL